MSFPKLPHATQKALIITGITVVGSVMVISWNHYCIRSTMLYDHRLWKERMALLSQQQDDESDD